jgi:hypothetical protein
MPQPGGARTALNRTLYALQYRGRHHRLRLLPSLLHCALDSSTPHHPRAARILNSSVNYAPVAGAHFLKISFSWVFLGDARLTRFPLIT